jgi:hypothetical protein
MSLAVSQKPHWTVSADNARRVRLAAELSGHVPKEVQAMSNAQNGGSKGFATSKAPSKVSITLYQGGHAVVREVREVTLDEGANTVLLEGLPAAYVPNSLKFRRVQGPGSFNPGCISIQPANLNLVSMLAASIGKEITLVQPTGVQRLRNSGKLLALMGNSVAIEKQGAKDKVLVVPINSGEFEFTGGIPDGLSATQSVILEPKVGAAGTYLLHSLYKTGGLNWTAHYTGFFNRKSGKFDRLECTILLVNQSGVGFDEATLKLFASANVAHAKSGRGGMRALSLAAAAPMGGAMPESVAMDFDGASVQTVGDQKMYTLDGEHTLQHGIPKEAYLLLSEDVPAVVELYIPNHTGYFELSEGEETKTGCSVRLRMKNDADSKLGSALPRGPMSIYEDDASGESQETNASAVPRDVAVGEDFALELQNPSSDVKYVRRMVASHDDPEPEEVAEETTTDRPIRAQGGPGVGTPEAHSALRQSIVEGAEGAEADADAEAAADEETEAPRFHTETRETVVFNFGTEAAEVNVHEQFPQIAEFSDESHTFASKGNTQGTYKVTVPAGDKVTVRYSLKWRIN